MTYTLLAMHPEDFLSLEEWHRLLKAVQSPRETALLWLFGGAGLRVSHLVAWMECGITQPKIFG